MAIEKQFEIEKLSLHYIWEDQRFFWEPWGVKYFFFICVPYLITLYCDLYYFLMLIMAFRKTVIVLIVLTKLEYLSMRCMSQYLSQAVNIVFVQRC